MSTVERSPRVGEMVHYVSWGSPVRADGTQAYTSRCRAAYVTQTHEEEGLVGLAVLNPTGTFFHERVPQHGAGEAEFLGDGDAGGEPVRDLCGAGALRWQGGTWHFPVGESEP